MADTDTSSTGRSSPRQYPPESKQRAVRMVLDSYDRGEERFALIQSAGPEVALPEGVDLAELGALGVRMAGMSAEEGAALPVNYLTAYQLLEVM